MAYKINEECVSCGQCEDRCPVSAISQGESQFEIDPAICVSCGVCASVCPKAAIEEE